jgi:hypothetical protein
MVGFASKSIIELSQYIWWVFKSWIRILRSFSGKKDQKKLR